MDFQRWASFLLFSFWLKYEGDIPFGSSYTICIMICSHKCLSVNTHTHASVHTHNWSCLRMRCTYIIRKNVYQKQPFLLYKPYHIIYPQIRICLGAYSTYLASQDNFKWVPNCPKNKPVCAMWKCIVFMSNPTALIKNGTVPTNSFISQHLLILDYLTWSQNKAYV